MSALISRIGLALAATAILAGAGGAQQTAAPAPYAPASPAAAPAVAAPAAGPTPAPAPPVAGAAGSPAAPAAPGTPAPPAAAAPASPAAPSTPPVPAAGSETPAGPDPLVDLLTDQGLENVVVHREGREIRIAYENRRYRWNVTGLGVVLAAAAEEAPAGAELVVRPKVWGVPEMEVRVAADDYRQFLEGRLSEKEFRPRFHVGYAHGGSPAAGANRSFGRTDLTAGLGYRASFTTEDPREGFYPRLLAGVEGALFPGLGFSGQQIVPLSRETTKLTQARLGGVLHPIGPLFLSVDGGRLAEDQDAIQGEAAWVLPSGSTSLRFTFTSGYDHFYGQNSHSALLTVTQWLGHNDIALSVVGGRFWQGDQGAEVFLQSGFRERRFIIGGGRSGGVNRVEVQAILPLGRRVESRPRPFRFKIRDTFNGSYIAPKGLITSASVGGSIPPSLLAERSVLFSPPIIRSYLKELRQSADLLQ